MTWWPVLFVPGALVQLSSLAGTTSRALAGRGRSAVPLIAPILYLIAAGASVVLVRGVGWAPVMLLAAGVALDLILRLVGRGRA